MLRVYNLRNQNKPHLNTATFNRSIWWEVQPVELTMYYIAKEFGRASCMHHTEHIYHSFYTRKKKDASDYFFIYLW